MKGSDMQLRRTALLLAAALVACCLCGAASGLSLPDPQPRSAFCKAADKHAVYGCVKTAGGGLKVSQEDYSDCVASAVYVDSAHTSSNFGKLRVVTSAAYPDVDQMYAAGFVEGYLTAARIYDNFYNMRIYFTSVLNASLDEPLDWLEKQQAWAAQQVSSHQGDASEEGTFWRLVGLVTRQWEGLAAGYQARAAEEPPGSDEVGWLTIRELSFMNNNGEIYDLIDYFEAGGGAIRPDNIDPNPRRMANRIATQGKCSALIKVTGDLGELLMGHSTWDTLTAMTRIYKHYEFNLADPAVVTRRLSFSSYPGEVFSDDDLYLLESGLVVLETTNHIYTPDVYKPLTPESVVSWQRVRVANMVGRDGASWLAAFSTHNSGTYNNQYMVVDTNKFVPRVEMQPGLLTVVEQLPGMIRSADMTEELSRGYWPSYNVAYFKDIYEAAGYPQMIERLEQMGAKKYAFSIAWLKPQTAPRANIWRRDQGKVSSLEDMKTMMRYNDWKNDPYSLGNPLGAVCGRGDLDPDPEAIFKACYDTKVTSYSLARKMESEVVGGPTAQGQPPFRWDELHGRWADMPHRGMPNLFNFTFERMSAKDLPLPSECGTNAFGATVAAAL